MNLETILEVSGSNCPTPLATTNVLRWSSEHSQSITSIGTKHTHPSAIVCLPVLMTVCTCGHISKQKKLCSTVVTPNKQTNKPLPARRYRSPCVHFRLNRLGDLEGAESDPVSAAQVNRQTVHYLTCPRFSSCPPCQLLPSQPSRT